ncbi:MAG TPA: ATP-binding protein [Frateuria sp.]|uniref:AAA family ATPase n=1 Tax=Frateuria sp. TaxID=2211372 RepID=UPI002DE81FF0|nr:ATP-binding protein [Frateuria sp.]
MARSDLLISLVRAAASGDRATVRSTAEALAADERAKNHHIVADRLQRAIANVAVTSSSLLSVSEKTAHHGRDAIIEIQPQIQMDQLLLGLPVRESGRQLVEEHARADVLRSHGYDPRHRVLLSGPPGNGKTSFAESIAEALNLPFMVVRYDALIGSYLGETNARLRKLFDYVRTQPCVLFFDEFDAIGKERGDTHETGEIKRVVSFLLMQLDQLPSYVIVVAATNHAELLDRAVWRRFQMRLAFPAPSQKEIEALLERIMRRWPQMPKMSRGSLAAKLGSLNFSEVLDFCQNVRRREILGLGETGIDDALKAELDIWRSRVRPEVTDGGRSKQATAEGHSRAGRRSSPAKKRVPKRP